MLKLRAAHTAPLPWTYVLRDAVLQLCFVLPLLIFLSLGKIIDLQGILIIVAGTSAWTILFYMRRLRSLQLPRYSWWLLGIYTATCLISLIAHPSVNNLYGSVLVRLGSLALISCSGCGLLFRTIAPDRLLKWSYLLIVLTAGISLIYNAVSFHSLVRMGGVFHQADILAAWLGCGFIFGWQIWQTRAVRRRYTGLFQLLLFGSIVLTQTRAALIFLTLITVVMIARAAHISRAKRLLATLGVVLLLSTLLVLSHVLLPNRLNDGRYAVSSTTYRLHLMQAGLHAIWKQPLTGYGAGNLNTALACRNFHDSALKKTCRDGYFFDSSHNIFLDRVLSVGILGGLCFIVLVMLCVHFGLRASAPYRYYAYGALFISLYYLTNVTNIELELLLCICVLRSLPDKA